MSRITRVTFVVSASLLLLWLAAAATAQTTVKREPVKPGVSIAGSATFKEYCSPCHGVSGRGDGPAAAALKVPPADLTTIAKRAGGTFPFARVKSSITGDDVIAAHGSRDMPMWGPLFKSVDANTAVVELRLTNVIKYVEQIQAK